MPTKKNPTKKTAAAKAVLKKTPVKEAAPKEKAGGMLSWLFVPDIKQGWGRWCLRAGLFMAAFWVLTLGISVLELQARFAEAGLGAVPFWTAAGIVFDATLSKLVSTILLTCAVYFAVGMFAFMPRRRLDRHSFFAAILTFLSWGLVSAGLITLAKEHLLELSDYVFPLVILPLAVLAFISIVAVFAAVACWAKKINVSGAALFLSFPFGWSLFEWTGFFLPFKDGSRAIQIKYNWYKKLVDFMLDNVQGQILMALVIVAIFGISPSPWEAFMIVFFGGLYFWKKPAWLQTQVAMLSWVAAALNIAAIAGSIYYANVLMTAAKPLAG